jgi:glycosyltransferase involved in cell wall biosynthesis
MSDMQSAELSLRSGAMSRGVRVAVVSRCSWTLFNFRRKLIHGIAAHKGVPTALGSCEDGFDHRLRNEGIDVHHIPVSRTGVAPAQDIRLFLSLVKRFRVLRPDVVHSFTIKPSIYATFAAAVCNVPVRVVTITGLGHAFTSAGSFVRALVSFLYRVALARADTVFFQNRDDRDLFVARGLVDERATRVIAGSGVDVERFRATPLPQAEGGLRFLMISRLLKDKGVSEYVSAAEKLKSRYPAAHFQLVGGADARNPSCISAAELAALRISKSVEWLDEVEDVRPNISGAHVVVLPSYREGLPRSLLEGGAMGRALIATDVPGCREVVSDNWNGYLVPPSDADALAQAMERLILDTERIELFGARARQLVQSTFDERKVVDQTIQTYVELLRRKVQTGFKPDRTTPAD